MYDFNYTLVMLKRSEDALYLSFELLEYEV